MWLPLLLGSLGRTHALTARTTTIPPDLCPCRGTKKAKSHSFATSNSNPQRREAKIPLTTLQLQSPQRQRQRPGDEQKAAIFATPTLAHLFRAPTLPPLFRIKLPFLCSHLLRVRRGQPRVVRSCCWGSRERESAGAAPPWHCPPPSSACRCFCSPRCHSARRIPARASSMLLASSRRARSTQVLVVPPLSSRRLVFLPFFSFFNFIHGSVQIKMLPCLFSFSAILRWFCLHKYASCSSIS